MFSLVRLAKLSKRRRGAGGREHGATGVVFWMSWCARSTRVVSQIAVAIVWVAFIGIDSLRNTSIMMMGCNYALDLGSV